MISAFFFYLRMEKRTFLLICVATSFKLLKVNAAVTTGRIEPEVTTAGPTVPPPMNSPSQPLEEIEWGVQGWEEMLEQKCFQIRLGGISGWATKVSKLDEFMRSRLNILKDSINGWTKHTKSTRYFGKMDSKMKYDDAIQECS